MRIQVTSARKVGQAVSVQASIDDGRTLAVSIPIWADETPADLRRRVRARLRAELIDSETAQRRGTRLAAAVEDLAIDLARPARPGFDVQAGRVAGWIGAGTAKLLLVLSDGLERVVTPNKHGRFAVDLGGLTFVSITPVGPDGLLGEEVTG